MVKGTKIAPPPHKNVAVSMGKLTIHHGEPPSVSDVEELLSEAIIYTKRMRDSERLTAMFLT